MKAKSTIYSKTLSLKRFKAFAQKLIAVRISDVVTTDFGKTITLSGENFVGQNFLSGKFSSPNQKSFFSYENFYLDMKKVIYEKRYLQ